MNYVECKRLLEPANWLTLVRLPMAGLLWVDSSSLRWLVGILIAAGLSDVLDGRLARALRARRIERGETREAVGRSHAIGAWLDPLCDKTFVISTLAVIYVGFQPPLWMLLAIAARELVLVPSALAYRLSSHLRHTFRFNFRAGAAGKIATVAQFCAIVWLLVDAPFLLPMVIATCILGIAAALFYLRRAVLTARRLASNEIIYARLLEMQGLDQSYI